MSRAVVVMVVTVPIALMVVMMVRAMACMIVVVTLAVVVTAMVMIRMRVIVLMSVVVRVIVRAFDGGFSVAAAANRTHQSTSSSFTRISSPPVTCSW